MKFLAYFSILGLATGAFAGQDTAHPHFVAVPGDHEFSGQMIARPKQVGALMRDGTTTYYKALQRKQQAAAKIAERAIDYRPQLDEYIIHVPKGSDEDKVAAELLATGNFEYVEPDWKVFIVSAPNDPLYPQQWHLPKIQAPLAWDLFAGNNSIIVAITDTGIKQDHEDLVPSLVPGYNAQTATTQASGADVNDTNGHGTHCAGIAGGFGNNAIGISGASQRVKLMPVKVVVGGSGSSSISVLTGGAVWAADHGARVVSTSFSGFQSSSVNTTGTYIKNTRNGFYCWAAGNDNRDLTTGDWVDVTVVGATDSNDAKASFSAFGLATDVFAPGVGIFSTYKDSTSSYTSLSGTSMATPCVAGCAALLLMANPSMTAQQCETILYSTCNNIGSNVTFGNGRVNLNAALRSVYTNTTFSPSSITVTIGALAGGGTSSLPTVDNQFLVGTTQSIVSRTSTFQFTCDTFTTISSIGVFKLTYAGMAQAADVMVRTELFDNVANAWTLIDQRLSTTSTSTFTLQPSSPNRFKDANGKISARFTYVRTGGRASLQVSADQIAFTTAP